MTDSAGAPGIGIGAPGNGSGTPGNGSRTPGIGTEAPASAPPRRRRATHFSQYPLRRRILLSQLPLTISAVLVTLAVLVFEPAIATVSPHLLGGLGGILALTVAAGTVPWQKVPPVVYWVIPLLDFVAIAPLWSAARYVLDGMILLCAFPVVWLAWSGIYPLLAICVGFVASTIVAWWPYLVEFELGPDLPVEPGLARPALVPFLMLALAIASSILTRSMDRTSKELAASLANAATQNRMLHTVVDTSEVGILVVDRDGHDLLMNPAQRRNHFLGLPPGQSDGPETDLLMFETDGTTPIPAPDRPVVRALQGESFQGRIIALGTQGSQQQLAVSAAPMLCEDGTFDGTVVVFHNVTDLIGAIRSRERFVAEISHEFRTPLTSIIGYLDLALDSDPDPVLERYLNTSIRNAERLLTLVTNLLDASASTSTISVQEVDLVRLARDSMESVEVRSQRSEVQVIAELPLRLTVQADPVKLGQVVDNLLSNAVKYTPPGGTVTVSLRRTEGTADGEDPDGDWAELTVRDTGIGMTEEERGKLFQSFYRTEHVRKAAIPGTGLGLAISRGFVQAHGGEIRVTSQEGVGSAFTVRVPVQGPGPALR